MDEEGRPVIVRMRVERARWGHAEDETYEFDLPLAKAQLAEAYEPGKCPILRHATRPGRRDPWRV